MYFRIDVAFLACFMGRVVAGVARATSPGAGAPGFCRGLHCTDGIGMPCVRSGNGNRP